jgi:hypothetical protein
VNRLAQALQEDLEAGYRHYLGNLFAAARAYTEVARQGGFDLAIGCALVLAAEHLTRFERGWQLLQVNVAPAFARRTVPELELYLAAVTWANRTDPDSDPKAKALYQEFLEAAGRLDPATDPATNGR